MRNYVKKEDTFLLSIIKNILENRLTYGYKKVTAMVNNKIQEKHGKVNKKRIYIIFKNKGLLLPKTEVQRREHTGTGKIITLHSNTRWCSDGFEIRFFNDEKVYVAFSLDC
jgi:putative transposase